jgi:hypothetical protein
MMRAATLAALSALALLAGSFGALMLVRTVTPEGDAPAWAFGVTGTAALLDAATLAVAISVLVPAGNGGARGH